MPLPRPTDLLAPVYDAVMAPLESAEFNARRRSLLARARGAVLDVGAGTGANLPHYRDVDRVVALEPNRGMRRRLTKRAETAAVPVEVLPQSIEDAELPAQSFDTVVCTLVLCSVADADRVVARISELLRPDGQVLFLEHVGSPAGITAGMQRVLRRPWRRLAGGCDLRRDAPTLLRSAGLPITDLDRFRVRRGWPVTAACCVGVARPRSAFGVAA